MFVFVFVELKGRKNSLDLVVVEKLSFYSLEYLLLQFKPVNLKSEKWEQRSEWKKAQAQRKGGSLKRT